jgi:HEAT repeats
MKGHRAHRAKVVAVFFILVVLVLGATMGIRVSRQVRVSFLVEQLSGPKRLNARNVLRRMGTKAVPCLLAEAGRREPLHERVYQTIWSGLPTNLQHRLPSVPLREQQRASALRALGFPGVASDTAVAGLIQLLDDPDGAIRLHVVMALGQIGLRNPLTIPALIRALEDSDAGTRARSTFYVRELAAQTLGRMGASAKAAVPRLTEMLNDSHGDARHEAAIALWRINGNTNVIPHLISELARSTDPIACRNILTALGEIGPAAKAAVPEVLRKFEYPSWLFHLAGATVPDAAREALAKIDPEAAAKVQVAPP